MLEAKRAELADSPLRRGTRRFEEALLSVLLGDADRALDLFDAMPVQGSAGLLAMYRPAFDTLRGHAAYDRFLARAGLGPHGAGRTDAESPTRPVP